MKKMMTMLVVALLPMAAMAQSDDFGTMLSVEGTMKRYVISLTGMASVLYLMMLKMPNIPMPTPMPVFPFISSKTKIMKKTMKKMETPMRMKVK